MRDTDSEVWGGRMKRLLNVPSKLTMVDGEGGVADRHDTRNLLNQTLIM